MKILKCKCSHIANDVYVYKPLDIECLNVLKDFYSNIDKACSENDHAFRMNSKIEYYNTRRKHLRFNPLNSKNVKNSILPNARWNRHEECPEYCHCFIGGLREIVQLPFELISSYEEIQEQTPFYDEVVHDIYNRIFSIEEKIVDNIYEIRTASEKDANFRKEKLYNNLFQYNPEFKELISADPRCTISVYDGIRDLFNMFVTGPNAPTLAASKARAILKRCFYKNYHYHPDFMVYYQALADENNFTKKYSNPIVKDGHIYLAKKIGGVASEEFIC